MTVEASPLPLDALADPAETVESWVRWLNRTGLADNSKRAYAHAGRAFAHWLVDGQAEHRVGEVFTDPHARDYAVRDYRRHLLGEVKRAPKGVDSVMTGIAALYEWIGLGRPNIPRAGRDDRPPTSLDDSQVRAVLRAAERRSVRDLAITATLLGTGVRVSELAALDVDDVWVTARQGEAQVRLGKGDKPRRLPLGAQTRDALRPWLAARSTWAPAGEMALFVSRSGTRLAVRTVRHAVEQIGVAAGVDLAPHVLRHTFATRLIRDGADVVIVSQLLGHASLDTIRVYTQPTWANMTDAVESIHIDY